MPDPVNGYPWVLFRCGQAKKAALGDKDAASALDFCTIFPRIMAPTRPCL
jgi:hypothetical protein